VTLAEHEQKQQADLATAAPSKSILAAAKKALKVLTRLLERSALDLSEATLIEVEKVTLQAPLSESSRANSGIMKTVDLGYVDMLVSYKKPPTVTCVLALKDNAVEVNISDFQNEDGLLEKLQTLGDEKLRVSYMLNRYRGYGTETALFTVRTGEWTLMEVIQELRNLNKSDQAKSAKLVLVAPFVSPEYRLILSREGFYSVDETDLQAWDES
jgi:hypothetical protein